MNYTKEEITQANKTCRDRGSVGERALVPRYILKHSDIGKTYLDFGAGKRARHVETLRMHGLEVDAYDFGDNFVRGLHVKLGKKKYDVVYASNVLNVQTNEEMLHKTLLEIVGVCSEEFICNYPESPRKCRNISVGRLREILEEYFLEVERVGGSSGAPIFRCKI